MIEMYNGQYDTEMVLALGNNEYTLTKTSETTSLLALGRKYYEWSRTPNDRGILTRIKKPSSLRGKAQKGNYWLFDVHFHPKYTPGIHLSLASADSYWNNYILDGHFPLKTGESCFLIPTHECVARPQRSQPTTAVIP